MPTIITTIQEGDLISGSRTDINNNFDSVLNNKIETSTLDTDTTLAANSDSKIATQKATKAYVDASVNPTGRSWNEYAADAGSTDAYAITLTGISAYATGQTFKFKANTANTGACTLNVSALGAKTIKKDVTTDLATGDILANQDVVVMYDGTNMQLVSSPSGVAKTTDVIETYTVGALKNSLVKTYFNIQLPFTLWTGSTSGALTTDFANWERTDATDVFVSPLGSMVDFQSTGSASIILNSFFRTGASTALQLTSTNIVVLDWWAKLPSSGTGDIAMGFGTPNNSPFLAAYTATDTDRVMFNQSAAGTLYATISYATVGVTNTDISSGLTLTNWNNYRIELDLSNNALFYVNGTLKATLSGANFPVTSSRNLCIGFGRSNTSLYQITAPTLSLQMNP